MSLDTLETRSTKVQSGEGIAYKKPTVKVRFQSAEDVNHMDNPSATLVKRKEYGSAEKVPAQSAEAKKLEYRSAEKVNYPSAEVMKLKEDRSAVKVNHPSADEMKQKDGKSAEKANHLEKLEDEKNDGEVKFKDDKEQSDNIDESRPPEVVLKSILASMRASMSQREKSNEERRNLHAFTRTVLALVVFVTLILVSIFEVVVGLATIGLCPIRPVLPVWLIVSGTTGLIRNIAGVVFTLWEDKKRRVKKIRDCFLGMMLAIWLFWLIMGSYWTYSIYSAVDFDEHHYPSYCHQFVYYFTFFIITATHVIIAILVCCACYCIVFLCCYNSSVVLIT